MNGRGLAAILAPGKAAPGATTVPCPKADPGVVPNHPPRAKAPADDPVLRAVGGAALDTDGLAAPDGAPAPPALTATSWLVADLDSGAVLGGCGPHVHGTPASVQKLLLAATALPKLDANQQMTVTSEDLKIERGSSAVGLLVGGHYSIETMNAKAHELGAFQTHAATPSGLDGPGQFTSAYDLALIARECFARDDFRKYALTPNATIPAQPPKTKTGFQIQNENTLIFKYAGALGGKTGFTDLARHTYVGAAERGGRRLVATVLGAEARPLRGWQQGAALLDWGFSLPRDARVGELVPPGTDPRAPSPTPKPAEAVEAAPATLTGGATPADR
jgi:D-alanyl-D-alanine carboxypeptidase (penicillin-binding protein 5/6)